MENIEEIKDYIAKGIQDYRWSDEFTVNRLTQQGFEEDVAKQLIADVKKERHVTNNSFLNDDNKTNELTFKGLTFHPFKLIIGVVIGYFWFFTDTDWEFILSLAIVVLIHELGHVIMGKSFVCFIEEMQVFFLSFVSYKPKNDNSGSLWKNIKWSLGILPLGGFTTFKTQKESEEYDNSNESTHASPFIDHKPAWQRLLISAGGILFNLATFIWIYFYLPFDWAICNSIMVLSLVLAVLNFIPIYPLDGGLIIFSCYEMITGKKPATWFVRICGVIGLALIIILFWIFPGWISDNIIKPIIDVIF